ncbi:MAG TPA: GNAT family N-acetyltransferase [Pseudonocardia sp.]|uniref:GNAT family N-acetyltransferase n=1 Tax=Pseudonocardia sp. TaxID=60912 RepID=UPI002B7433CB|nr:GNAT family N-acetyltransferase [Pseudonocardia sp.]HTF49046.1 GNAT family N-acetyltransferase [Pseudonocardia sp.]
MGRRRRAGRAALPLVDRHDLPPLFRPAPAPGAGRRRTVRSGGRGLAVRPCRGPRVRDLVAVARYEGNPTTCSAETAVVVDDALHRQGVGRALFGRLVDVSRERGVNELVAEVLPDNSAMLNLLRSLGLPLRAVSDGDSRKITVPVA